jgi:hypothetical protein
MSFTISGGRSVMLTIGANNVEISSLDDVEIAAAGANPVGGRETRRNPAAKYRRRRQMGRRDA